MSTNATTPLTRVSLFIKIRETNDDNAWTEFVEIYTPLIYAYARRQGLQDADAADVTQDVMTSINRAIQNFDYDPTQGTFRGWLFTVTRNQISRFWKKQSRRGITGDEAMQAILDQRTSVSDEAFWNQQHQWRLLYWAAEKVKTEFTQSTWNAFALTAFEQKKPQQVAAEVGISVGAVYIAKSRVIKRIRELIKSVESD